MNRSHLFIVWVLLSIGTFAPIEAQVISLSPYNLVNLPRGATDSNPYWQGLVIDLRQNPSVGNTIEIFLPEDVSIADIDGDGSYEDEIALDDASTPGTGYTSVQGSTANQILLTSETGGIAGSLYVHFPITTPANQDRENTVYGQVVFSNDREPIIPAGSIRLNFVEPYDLQVSQFSMSFDGSQEDTLTHVQGSVYPDSAGVVFTQPVPDMLSDVRGILSNNTLERAGISYGDADDTNDTPYKLWFSLRDSLTRVDTSVAVRAINSLNGELVSALEGDSLRLSLDVSALLDSTYFLYVTSSLTGNFPLMRSRGVRVRHQPVVLSVGTFLGGDADYIDSGLLLNLDNGTAGKTDSARARLTIPFQVVDNDDSASVKLFYSRSDTLDTSFVVVSGTWPDRSIERLSNATQINSSIALIEGRDEETHWSIVSNDSVFVESGDYYVYAVITDGKNLDMRRSDHTYNVRHSPLLILDSREDRLIETGGGAAERYYTISWNQDYGVNGDVALEDSALIALYYSASDSFAVPNGTSDIMAAAADSTRDTHLIVNSIAEDPDGVLDNQYVWDLWRFKNDDGGGVPQEDVPYALYGIVQTDSTRRLVRWDDERGVARTLRFSHRPYLRITSPLGPLEVDGRRSFSIEWEAVDVDEDATMWVLLTSLEAAQGLGDSTDYQSLIGDGLVDWVANSLDGSLGTASILSEDTTAGFAVRPARLTRSLDGQSTPLVNGEYHAYVIIADSDAEVPPDTALVRRVEGLIRIVGLEAGAVGLETAVVEMVPAKLSMSVPGDTATVALRPHSGGAEIDLLSFFASVDTSFFSVVDQDRNQPGIQPFRINPLLTGLVLRDTLLVGADSLNVGNYLLDLIYYDQLDTDLLDGDLTLAEFQVVSRDTVGSSEVMIDHAGNRQSAFYHDGEIVTLIPPQTGVAISTLTRGEIRGRVSLQGRSEVAGLVTFLLRDYNSILPIADSLFVAANDLDSTQVGIQDSIAADGSFHLREIPGGRYQLAVHVDSYLDGYYPLLEVYPGTVLFDVNPTYAVAEGQDVGYLLGGDVTGYVDADGNAEPDNEVDQLDIDFVVSYFGQTVRTENPGYLADVDRDSLVWISDLNIVAANFNRQGVQPVYKKAASLAGSANWFTNAEELDGIMEIDVAAVGLVDARAFAFRLLYDPLTWAYDGLEGQAFDGLSAVAVNRHSRGQVVFGSALSGDQRGVSGERVLAKIRLRRVGEGLADIRLIDAEWVDANLMRHRSLAERIRPLDFALLPAYPNPFNPETQIRFTLPEAAFVRLEIYDGVGQRIRSLLGSPHEAGTHVTVWDGRDDVGRSVASGPYFACLSSVGRIAVRKMLLLR